WAQKAPGGVFQGRSHSAEQTNLPLNVAPEAVEEAFGKERFIVVSDPTHDERLQFLLDALPEDERTACAGCQRAAILLKDTNNVRLLPPALFLLVVRPPQRLSYYRVQRMLDMLYRTFSDPRHKGTIARRGPHSTSTTKRSGSRG